MSEVVAPKPWYTSKTIWTNLIMAVTVIFWPGVNDWVAANLDTVAIGWTVINTILRLLTKGSVQIS